jgi:predicted AlkP superfamily pyrophosphatase or phosphodiesterase
MPILLINAVGLTPKLIPLAPQINSLVRSQWQVPLRDVLPSVTCTAQASLLTGSSPQEHGIVGNGWFFRDTSEIRFWQQSNRLMQREPIYETARKRATQRGKPFKSAKLFWWFNQGAAVDLSVTPKPHYGIDGNKVFGITGTPEGFSERLESELGAFPFHTFWGPMAGLPCTDWIARAAAFTLTRERPDLTLVYLPHLDYDPQRFGPEGSDMPKLVGELDRACTPLFEAAKQTGTEIWIVSEYGHVQVNRAVEVNRALRKANLLQVRRGPFGEQLDTYGSRAFAVCDHQLAHLHIRDEKDQPLIHDLLQTIPGIAKIYRGEEREEIQLNHPRSGEFVLLSEPDSWFAYPFWLDDAIAPDYARCVAIHHKPGYDPVELLVDPKLWFPKVKIISKVLSKKLGFRMSMNVIPLDSSLVKGSHGRVAPTPEQGPLLIGCGSPPPANFAMTDLKELLLNRLDLGG